jgi:hypothetical protein
MIQFENRYVRVFGPTVEVKLPSLKLDGSQHLDFRLVGQMNLDGAGYEADDAPILSGMAERKGGFWAGAKVKWHNGLADVNLEWLGDASSYSKGQRLSLALEKTWRMGDKLMLTPRVGLAWWTATMSITILACAPPKPGPDALPMPGDPVSSPVPERGQSIASTHITPSWLMPAW